MILLSILSRRATIGLPIRNLVKCHRELPVSLFKMTSRCNSRKLSSSILEPPMDVRGMKILDRKLFEKQISVPSIRVTDNEIECVLKSVKKYLLRMDNVKSVIEDCHDKVILLNPDSIKSLDDLDENSRRILHDVGIDQLQFRDFNLTYSNYKSDQILDAVLPDDLVKTTGYSRIGHIVHVNLREYLLDYRYLIGQVLLDKLKGVKCVVNKTDQIESEFRNFKMEILASDDDKDQSMIANVRENGCQYEFDFSQVFWNPRLSTEHDRLVTLLPNVGHVVLYDVFAGVGPFAVLAAHRRKCRVLANDLNPDSFRWLQHNIKLNKVVPRIACYNMDGRAFIQQVILKDMIECWSGTSVHHPPDDQDGFYPVPEMHIVMNLPAMAVQFLDAFRGLLTTHRLPKEKIIPPIVHCYTFIKVNPEIDDGRLDDNVVIDLVENVLRTPKLLDRSSIQVAFVRKVSHKKDMVRVTFSIPLSVLNEQVDVEAIPEPETKRLKVEDQ